MPFDPKNIEAVVFDMDGLLIDSEVLYQKAALQSARALGFTMDKNLQLQTVGLPSDETEILLRREMGPEFPFEEYDYNLREWLGAQLMAHVPVKPGVRELLSLLEQLEIPAAVATSTGREAANHHLSRADLAPHFETIVTRDDVENGKPHPEPFLLAAERLEVEPENCLALEDSHNGVRSAHGAGMQTIMVPDMLGPTDEMRALAISIVKDLHKVRAIFMGS